PPAGASTRPTTGATRSTPSGCSPKPRPSARGRSRPVLPASCPTAATTPRHCSGATGSRSWPVRCRRSCITTRPAGPSSRTSTATRTGCPPSAAARWWFPPSRSEPQARRVRDLSLDYKDAVSRNLYTPIGEGGADVARVTEALRGSNYGGWYTLQQDTRLATADDRPLGRISRSLEFVLPLLS